VPGEGVEPPRPCDRKILSPLIIFSNPHVFTVYSVLPYHCVGQLCESEWGRIQEPPQ
jgi:hypothetical protein